MSRPIPDLPEELVEVSIDEVNQMLSTPGVQITFPNAGGDVVYEVQDDMSIKKLDPDAEEGK